MKNPKDGASDPTVVVVTPAELTRQAATAQAAGTVVVLNGTNSQQEIEQLRKEAAELLDKAGKDLTGQVQNLMEERDGLMEDKGKLLLTVEELKGENANLLKTQEHLLAANENLRGKKTELMIKAREINLQNGELREELNRALRFIFQFRSAHAVAEHKCKALASDIYRMKVDQKETYAALGKERMLTQQLEDEVSRLLVENNELLEELTSPMGPSDEEGGADTHAPPDTEGDGRVNAGEEGPTPAELEVMKDDDGPMFEDSEAEALEEEEDVTPEDSGEEK